jgi:hypothetical protein
MRDIGHLSDACLEAADENAAPGGCGEIQESVVPLQR